MLCQVAVAVLGCEDLAALEVCVFLAAFFQMGGFPLFVF